MQTGLCRHFTYNRPHNFPTLGKDTLQMTNRFHAKASVKNRTGQKNSEGFTWVEFSKNYKKKKFLLFKGLFIVWWPVAN